MLIMGFDRSAMSLLTKGVMFFISTILGIYGNLNQLTLTDPTTATSLTVGGDVTGAISVAGSINLGIGGNLANTASGYFDGGQRSRQCRRKPGRTDHRPNRHHGGGRDQLYLE